MLSDIMPFMQCDAILSPLGAQKGIRGWEEGKKGWRKEGVERPPVIDAHHPFFSSLLSFFGLLCLICPVLL